MVPPLAMALAVVVFTVLMLLNRESMRERVIAQIWYRDGRARHRGGACEREHP